MQKGGHQGTASHQHGRDCRVAKQTKADFKTHPIEHVRETGHPR